MKFMKNLYKCYKDMESLERDSDTLFRLGYKLKSKELNPNGESISTTFVRTYLTIQEKKQILAEELDYIVNQSDYAITEDFWDSFKNLMESLKAEKVENSSNSNIEYEIKGLNTLIRVSSEECDIQFRNGLKLTPIKGQKINVELSTLDNNEVYLGFEREMFSKYSSKEDMEFRELREELIKLHKKYTESQYETEEIQILMDICRVHEEGINLYCVCCGEPLNISLLNKKNPFLCKKCV